VITVVRVKEERQQKNLIIIFVQMHLLALGNVSPLCKIVGSPLIWPSSFRFNYEKRQSIQFTVLNAGG